MKIRYINDNIVIFINKILSEKIDYDDECVLESYFRKIFKKILQLDDVILTSFYEVSIRINKNYGTIIFITPDVDDFSYLGGDFSMKIVVEKDAIFLFEIFDPLEIKEEILNKSNLYYYNDKFYLDLIKEVDSIEIATILENGNLIYDELYEEIINKGDKIRKCI